MITQQYLQRIFEMAGLQDIRMDNAYTAILAKQLTQIETELYEEVFPDLKASLFIPIKTGINPGARKMAYRMSQKIGEARISDNGAGDPPKVAIGRKESDVNIVSIDMAYDWTIQDMRAAQMAGVPLEAEEASTVRLAIEQRIDEVLFKGDVETNITGIANNATVAASLVTPPTGTWSTADINEIQADVNHHINTTNANSKDGLPVNTYLLADTLYQLLAQTYVSVSAGTTLTLLQSIQNVHPTVSFEKWSKLETADAAGTGPRNIAYRKDPRVLSAPMPIPFEQFPPQVRGLSFEVPCHARVGGVIIRYPLVGITYMDGC